MQIYVAERRLKSEDECSLFSAIRKRNTIWSFSYIVHLSWQKLYFTRFTMQYQEDMQEVDTTARKNQIKPNLNLEVQNQNRLRTQNICKNFLQSTQEMRWQS
jgi:hypothetical protein